MARAMSAPAEWKPNATRVNTLILVLVDSISPELSAPPRQGPALIVGAKQI